MSMIRSAALLIARRRRWSSVIHTAVRRGKYSILGCLAASHHPPSTIYHPPSKTVAQATQPHTSGPPNISPGLLSNRSYTGKNMRWNNIPIILLLYVLS